MITRILCCCLAILAGAPVLAQDTDIDGKLLIELNAADPVESEAGTAPACTLSFFITNGMEQDIDSLVMETVLFDSAGQVDRLTLFDLGALPHARARVRQFSVPDIGCDQIGRILINGVQSCTGGTLDAKSCGAALVPSSRTKIEVIG